MNRWRGASAWTPARRRFPGSNIGWPAPASAGAWTRPTVGHGNWKRSQTVRGERVSTAFCWVWPWRRTRGCSGARSRSETFPASDIDLAGRLAELVDRLEVTLDSLAGPQTAQCWAGALVEGTARLAAPAPNEAWQEEEVRRAFEDMAGASGWELQAGAGSGVSAGPVAGDGTAAGDGAAAKDGTAAMNGGDELDLSEARALSGDRLRGRPTRANFRTGDLTICTLVPMRSVPHRVVCLLGLDDGLFPRPGDHDGDDLLLADPYVGDRDVPSEDRQLLLDALLAATEHLVITFEGRDQHLNQRRPPAVPVAELLDVVDKTVRLRDPARAARERVVVNHPLQAFNPLNFEPGKLHEQDAWRFDSAHLDGRQGHERGPAAETELSPARLPAPGGTTVQLSSLVRFLEHPVRAFLRERLGFYAGDIPDPPSDDLVVEMSPLERWALGDRLLEARLGGADLDNALAAERGRGLLPPGPLGGAALDEVKAVVEALMAEVETLPWRPRLTRPHRGQPRSAGTGAPWWAPCPVCAAARSCAARTRNWGLNTG